MMKNLVNLVIKAAFIILMLFVLIPMFGKSTVVQTIVTGLILTVLAYIVGDLWILPKFGNLAATIGDFAIGALVVWMMMRGLPRFVLTTRAVLIIALVLAVGEWFFHKYLQASAAGKKVDSP